MHKRIVLKNLNNVLHFSTLSNNKETRNTKNKQKTESLCNFLVAVKWLHNAFLQ